MKREVPSASFEAISPCAEINAVLVHAFSHGSVLAFKRMYDHYAPGIYKELYRCLGSEMLAKAIVQKVFTALWLKREKFTEAEEVKLFLFMKAKSEAVKCG